MGLVPSGFTNVSDPTPAKERVIGVAVGECGGSSSTVLCWLTLRANGSVVPGGGVNAVPSVVQSGVKAISAPVSFSHIFLALLTNGSIVQWSYASPTQVTAVQFPLHSAGLTFESISAGIGASYAVATGGSLMGWTNDNLTDISSSISANAQAAVVTVIAGTTMSLAIKTDGMLVGFDGAATIPAGADIPASISTGSIVTQVTARNKDAMALQTDGRVQVWGDSAFGQLQIAPELANGNVVVQQVAASDAVCIALTQQGAVYAWGNLFDGTASNITKVPRAALANVVKVAAGPSHALALLKNGSVIAWGDDLNSPSPVLTIPADVQDVVDIATGDFVAIGILRNGSIVQWGLNSTAPQLWDVTSVAVGRGYAAAVLGNGDLVMWPVQKTSDLLLDLGFARNLKVRKVVLGWYRQGFPAIPTEQGLVLLENGTVIPVPMLALYKPVLIAKPSPPSYQRMSKSGVIDMAIGNGFMVALKTDSTLPATPGLPSSQTPPPPPVPPPSQPPSPRPVQSATISLLMTIPATSQLATNNSLQLQFSQQLKAALASYFRVPSSQVTVHLQVLPAAQRPLQQARVPVKASANITATWLAGDQQTPAFLQQRAQTLQQQPSAALPSVMVQQFSIDTTRVKFNTADTSQLGASGPSISPTASPIDLPSSPGSSNKKISTAAIAGIAIACVVGVATVAALIIVMYRRGSINSSKSNPTLQPFVSSAPSAGTGTSAGIITPAAAIKIPGLSQGEIFMLATAQNYKWTDSTTLPDGPTQSVESGVNDTQLDMMIRTQQQQDDESAAVSQYCPAVQLSMEELRQQVHLLSDGLLGRGATALVFKCVWPSRFGPSALLAAKVLQNGFESDMSVLSSFSYEANLLAATQHPHVVKLYGYCLEPPTVCLILELLPCCLKDVLYKTPTDAACGQPASSQLICSTAGALLTAHASCSSMSVTTQAKSHTQSDNGTSKPIATSTATSETSHSAPENAPSVPDVPSKAMAHTLKPATLHQIVRVCTDVAAGLAYLHNQPAPDGTATDTSRLLSVSSSAGRIVHRDLKPANILLNSQGAAKISDFGLARQHDHTTFATINLGAGTLPYMAPELLVSSKAGVSGAACTNRVDIYSLGILMWELLMGQPPWKGMAPTAILAAVMNRRRLPLPGDVASADREHATMEVPLLHPLPAHSHPDLPKMCQIIQACWHGTLAALLQQLEKQEPKSAPSNG